MSADWSAVAKAINERLTELGLNQRELSERSNIALSIVRELRNNTVQRRRSGRTLEALSVALGWHPRHLAAVLLGLNPPAPDAGIDVAGACVPARLSAIESQLQEVIGRLTGLSANLTTMIEHANRDKACGPPQTRR